MKKKGEVSMFWWPI